MADVESPLITEVGANNIAPPPDGLPALSSPNAVYPDWRELAAMSKRWWNRANPTVTSGGSANAQTLTFGVAPTQGYVLGQRYAFIAGFANTGAMTINVNGLGAKAVQVNGVPLVGGELKVGLIVELAYDGTQFQLIAGSGAGSGAYLPLAGGTLTGALTVAPASGGVTFNLNKPIATVGNNIFGQTAGLNRWQMTLGSNVAEGGGNVGSDFFINRWNDAGVLIDTPLTITRSTGQVAIKGTSTNDSAAAAFVGEYISNVVSSPGITLASGTAANVTSVSLTAGDWDVGGEVWFAVGAGGATAIHGAITSTSVTIPAAPATNSSRQSIQASMTLNLISILSMVPARMSLAATTTIYLVASANFPSGTTTAYGRIGARRIR